MQVGKNLIYCISVMSLYHLREVKMGLSLEKVDPAVRAQVIESGDLVWLDPMQESKFEISGFNYIKEDRCYERLPQQGTEKIREFVRCLGRCTTGGQIRFRTDSCRIVLYVRKMDYEKSATGETHQKDFDLYVGSRGKEVFWSTTVAPEGQSSYVGGLFKTKQKKMREFLIHFPVYFGIEELHIGLEKDAVLECVPPRKHPQRVVLYGTSITQGGFCSRPGLAYSNILSRSLQREFLNFAFSGNGRNDPEVAELLAEVKDPAMFIIDSQGNCLVRDHVYKNLPEFIRILREKHPLVPIVLMSEIRVGPCRKEVKGAHRWRKDYFKIYQTLKKAGDKNLYWIDGESLWSKEIYSECTSDGVHPNDLGFYLIAQGMEKILKKILKKYGN